MSIKSIKKTRKKVHHSVLKFLILITPEAKVEVIQPVIMQIYIQIYKYYINGIFIKPRSKMEMIK